MEKMSFEEYALACFADLGDCGKSNEEKLEIIKNFIEVSGSVEDEKQKYSRYIAEGNDMQTMVNMFKGNIAKFLELVGVENFNDLADVPQILKDIGVV
ncbi:MAG: hypothetical protein GY774_00375 [Planctomycetes bacterium]|nr:hypothetical protein [Planctomycetota bacterium]